MSAGSILNVAPRNLRPYALSVCLLLMNALGDFPGPLVTGAVAKAFEGDCRGVQ